MSAKVGASGAAAPTPTSPAIADLELNLLLEGVYRVCGFDFRDYAPATIKRRISERVRAEGARSTTGLLERVLHEPAVLQRLIEALTHNAGSPFREPAFFAAFRERVLPRLRTFPHVRLWVIGSGEDAYGLAIILREADLAHRVRIYVTEASEGSVERAKEGAFPLDLLDEFASRYVEAGGSRQFSDYVDIGEGVARFKPTLRQQMVFAQHNLVTDGSFNEFHLVVARNVFSHFNRTLVYRAHQVVYESLVRLGYLGIGAKETLRYTPHQRAYEQVDPADQFYRRVR
ncbi:MAG TPA: CheR family methyltransferase [Candidatus Sulfotelmatobacter sp.]|nr:CheR family methyltransferase [Candidatus Sulfotelmatobacter sp.]